MKQNTNKIYVPKLFRKVNVKKLILILYCVVPLLVVSIGFASWLIVGADSSSTAAGTFYASDIINSYDYIEPVNNGTQTINMYPTSFVDGGNFVTTAKIDVKFTLNLTACYDLTEKKGNNKTLNAIFNLGFSSGTEFDSFFRNLTPTVKIGGKPITTTGDTIDGSNVKGSKVSLSSNDVTTNNVGKAIGRTTTIIINLEGASKSNDSDDKLDLVITYTLDPSTYNSSTASNYQNIYENVVKHVSDNKLTFMMDVTINDYAGDTTN